MGWAALARSEVLTGQQEAGSAAAGRLLRQQIVWSLLAAAACTAVAIADYQAVTRNAHFFFAAVVLALAAVYLFPAVNGAHRWLRLGGIGIQPSEFAKVAFICAAAAYLAHRDIDRGFMNTLAPLGMAALISLLVMKEPDLGTSLVFVPVLFAMLFAAGARRQDMVRLCAAGALLLPLLWSQMSHEQRSRITALWEQNGPHQRPTADGFHLDQARRTIAMGGLWGTILTTDDDALENAAASRLPEPYTDSIFCVIAERFGLIGAGACLLLFAAIIDRCLAVARAADDPAARLLCVGVAALFATEVLINTGMLAGLLPITGLSLPLVSYGGSGLVAHAIALGLVLSVARRIA
jgi:rod shape determining protein RodA